MKQILYLTLMAALVYSIYYLLFPPQIPSETSPNDGITEFAPPDFSPGVTIADDLDLNSNEPNNSEVIFEGDKPEPFSRLEIFGSVVDERNQPIDNTLVAEERSVYSTRTDAAGKYKIFVDIINNPGPVLRFLRSGYKDRRIEFKAGILKDKSVIEMDVALETAIESISVDGWIGNDIGAGLGGLKIQLTFRNSQGLDNIFQTTFSDERGYFSLEGVMSGNRYRLTVFSTPEYLFYVDEEFSVTHNTPFTNIILESLKFVDIGGMIVNTQGEPIPNFEIYINNLSTGMHVRKIQSDSSGFFSLRNFPAGEVSLSTQGPDYFKITGLTLAVNEYRYLKLVVDRGDNYLSGWVSDDNGIPVANALVKLDTKILDGEIVYSSYRVKGTDSTGGFFFDNLGSGERTISVDANGFNSREITHRFESQTDELQITLARRKKLF